MVSVTAIMRSTYYMFKIFPLLMVPLQMRAHARRAADAFEEQLLQSGLGHDIAHELAESYYRANKQMISQMTSPRFWAGRQ